MKKNRFVSLLLVIVLVFSLFPTSVVAADSVTTLTLSSVTAFPGTTISMDITIKDNPGILGATLSIAYDEGLTLTAIEAGDAFSALTLTKPGNLSANPFNLVWDGQELEDDDIKDGVIATLTFEVSDSAEAGNSLGVRMSYKNGGIVDNNLSTVNVETVDGEVSVIDYLPGDLNGDQEVNTTDVILLRRYIAGGYDITINTMAADVNDDAEINTTDIIWLRRYLAGGYDIELKPSHQKCNHTMEATSYKAPTCTEEGNIAYWYCTTCETYFNDAEGLHSITQADTILAANGHTVVIDEAVPATYSSTGLTEGSHCSVCEVVLVKQEEIPILQKTEYSITYNIAGNDTYLAKQNIEMPPKNVATYTAEDEVIFEDLSCPGYDFKGWYDSYGNPMPKIEKGTKRNITVYAKWETVPSDIVFEYDTDLAGLIDTSVLSNVTYTVNATKSLPVLSLAGYTFVGWSDENGVLCKQIAPGSIGEKTFYANWVSDRSKAWAAKDYGTPDVYEDDNLIMYTYEIGKVENIPIYEIEDFGRVIAGGIAETKTKEISAQTSTQCVEAYSSAIEKSTTGNATWTLSSGWSDSMSITEDWASEHGMTVEQAEEMSKSETGNWYVNTTRGGSNTSTTIDSTDTYNLATTTNNTKTYGSEDKTTYDSKTTEDGWNINGSLELGASTTMGASLGMDGTSVSASKEYSAKLTVAGEKDHKETSKEGSDTTKKTGQDSDSGGGTQEGTVKNHTSNTSSTSSWSNESGFGGSETTAYSQSVARAISESISKKTGYGKSYIQNENSSETQGLSTTNGNKDTFSSQVTYSTVTQEKETVTYSTAATVTGYHRWVMAGTAHVFGIVGYDKESQSYFTTTYSIMDDKLQKFQDYSYKTGSYDDNQSSVIDFCVPDDIMKHVKARMFETDGLEFNEEGYVTAYNGTDSAVVIPEYAVFDNLDGTSKLVKVVGIKEGVFKDNSNITGVVLSDFITEIPDDEFSGCTELWEVLGTGVTKIGANAFAGCVKLYSFTLSDDITNLGDNAFNATEFLEVKANNTSVVEAALKSGAKEIVIDLSVFNDTLDDKTLEVPTGTETFTLRGYGKNFDNLIIISHANETKLNRFSIVSDSAIPLQLESKAVSLCQVTVKAKGIGAVLNADTTEVSLYGVVDIATDGPYAVLIKNANLNKIAGNLDTKLNVTGDVVTCNTVSGEEYLNFTNGKINIVSESDFEKLLHTYTLYFDANGGDCAETERTVANGVAIGELPEPTREYYTFDGWYTEADGGNRATAETAYSTSVDITLYAHWIQNTVKISLDANGGTVEDTTVTAFCGTAIGSLPEPTRDYYDFTGWFTESGDSVTEDTVFSSTEDITLYAHWSEKSLSDWVLATNVPDGAKVVNTKYSFTHRYYSEGTSSSKSGWTRYDTKRTSWGATQGPVYSDPSNGSRNVWSESYVTSSNYKTIYHYYRYASVDSDGGGESSNAKYNNCVYYREIALDYELGSGVNSYGTTYWKYYYNGVNYVWYFQCSPYTTQQWVSDNYGTRWYYQEPVYTYYFYKDVAEESTTSPSGSEYSNIQTWVQYRNK